MDQHVFTNLTPLKCINSMSLHPRLLGNGVEGNKMHFTCFPISQSERWANERRAEPGKPCLQPLNWIFQDQTLHFTWALKTLMSYITMQTWWRFTCDWTFAHVPLSGELTIASEPNIWSNRLRMRRVDAAERIDETKQTLDMLSHFTFHLLQ